MDREVDVDVGHRLAARVEEALEEQVVLDRVDVGDLEAVGDERAGRRAAARADADPVALRERDEVPDDQEVVGEAHLADRLQLELRAARGAPASPSRSGGRRPASQSSTRYSNASRPPGVGIGREQDPAELHRHACSARRSRASAPSPRAGGRRSACISSGVLK